MKQQYDNPHPEAEEHVGHAHEVNDEHAEHGHGECDQHDHDGHDHDGHGHAHGLGGHHHDMRGQPKGKLALVILLNVIITIAEYVAGVLSGSLALISDAAHNFSDVLALILSYAGERVAERKPDSRFSFGLKRFEVLIALINAVTLVGIGIYIVVEAAERFQNPRPINAVIVLPVALIGLFANLFSMLLLTKSRKHNLNLRAAFLHLLYDTISSVGVVGVAVVLLYVKWYWLDLLVSLGIAVMIVYSAMGILSESLRIFLQGTPRHIDPDNIRQELSRLYHVEDVHGLHIWSVSSQEVFLSCHIRMPKGGDHNDMIRRINEHLAAAFGIEHTAIQVESDGECASSNACC